MSTTNIDNMIEKMAELNSLRVFHCYVHCLHMSVTIKIIWSFKDCKCMGFLK